MASFEFTVRAEGFGAADAVDRLVADGWSAAHGMSGQVYLLVTARGRDEAESKARSIFRSVALPVDAMRCVRRGGRR
jgi:hypothetical protein